MTTVPQQAALSTPTSLTAQALMILGMAETLAGAGRHSALWFCVGTVLLLGWSVILGYYLPEYRVYKTWPLKQFYVRLYAVTVVAWVLGCYKLL